MLTLSGLKQDLAGVTTFPDVLNNLSEVQLVAKTENSFLVNFAREEKVLACSFHHNRGVISLSSERPVVVLSLTFLRKTVSFLFFGGGGSVLDFVL